MNFAWSKKSAFLLIGIMAVLVFCLSMYFALMKPVAIAADGKKIETRVLFTGTVADVLEKEKITLGAKDTVEPALDAPVKKHMDIIVTRAFKVKVIADGQSKEILTTPVPIKKAIAIAGFKLGEKDIVKTLPEGKVVPNQEIEVIRVTAKELEEKKEMPCGVERISDATLEKGLTRTVKTGKNGLVKNTVRITYHNGKEVKREVVRTETLVHPQSKVVAMGSITEVSRGGQRFNFDEARYMSATAYTYTGFRTATGRTPAVGMVAVDPRVIPLGSKLYIEGYGYATAADTGGAVKGNTIDLFMEERGQCLNWGRRVVKVYVIQ